MPRNLPFYTRCAPPGEAHAFDTAGNILWELLLGILFAGVVGSGWIILALIGAVAGYGCAVGIAIGAFFIYGLTTFKTWYYNERLMCIKRDQCAVGTIVGEPHDAPDGDRKMDTLVAPFTVVQTEQRLIEMLDTMRGQLPNLPDLIDLQNRQVLFGYVQGLAVADKKRVYIRMADEKLFFSPAVSFQRQYYRRDQSIMGNEAFAHSPDDALSSNDPNPMFSYTAEGGGDPEEQVLVPWMHCEIEGYRLGRWLENILIGFAAAFVTFAGLCIACDVLTFGAADFLCGWLGGVAAAIVGVLAWLLSHFINDPDGAVAGEIDVDVADTDFATGSTESRAGDVVFLFGDWVMDTEHGAAFEIHPVKAYYLLCQSMTSPNNWLLTEDEPAAACEFNPNNITAEDVERICKIVMAAENTDPEERLTVEIQRAMAMMR